MTAELIPWAWSLLQESTAVLAATIAKKGISKGSAQLGRVAASAWQKTNWIDAENAYRQNLLTIVRATKVLGNPKPIDIDKIYTDVYVFDKLSAIRRYSETLDEDEADVHGRLGDRNRIDAKEIIESGGNKFILGRPGAGKTTFLKYLAMTACKGIIGRTPIFVSLKDWSDESVPLLDFVAKQFDICGFPDSTIFLEAMFSEGRAIVLFDGLDEVNEWSDKRNLIIRDIVNFTNKYRINQYFLTCRTAATDYSFDNFDYVEVADFTNDQQEQFAKQWYGSGTPTLLKFVEAWRDPRNSGLRDLGRTPLLLTLLCLSFDETHAFPKRQVELYQEAINALLKKWDTSRLITRDSFYRDLSFGQRQQLVETIAATFYFNSRTVFQKSEVAEVSRKFFASLPDVEDVASIDGTEIIRQIEAQHGLIVERAHGLFTFSHLTIQEYLTASYISKNQDANLQRQVVKSAMNDQKWREVMLYTVGLLPQADSILDEMKRQLLAMKQASSGVLIFLCHCYSTARLSSVSKNLKTGSQEHYLYVLRTGIDSYISELRQPSLTIPELVKFSEHIEVLHDFLRVRSNKVGFEISARVVEAAAGFLKRDQLDAARLLGGYFIKPEQFINFFYACRLFMECLEVAITSKRSTYLAVIFNFEQSEFERVEKLIRA